MNDEELRQDMDLLVDAICDRFMVYKEGLLDPACCDREVRFARSALPWLLRECGYAPTDIARAMGFSLNEVTLMLIKMDKRHELQKTLEGVLYLHQDGCCGDLALRIQISLKQALGSEEAAAVWAYVQPVLLQGIPGNTRAIRYGLQLLMEHRIIYKTLEKILTKSGAGHLLWRISWHSKQVA